MAAKRTPLTVAQYDNMKSGTEGAADVKPHCADALRARRSAIIEGRLIVTPRDETPPTKAEQKRAEAAAEAEAEANVAASAAKAKTNPHVGPKKPAAPDAPPVA